MKQTKTGRVLATIFLGLMFGIYRHFEQLRWISRGREAYLVDQGQRFDKFLRYHSSATMLAAGVLLAVIGVGLYELIAAGITSVLPPSTVEE